MRTQWTVIEELIEIVEKSASSRVYSLLKRSDEKFVTEKAYRNPVFVEDSDKALKKFKREGIYLDDGWRKTKV